MNRNSLRPMSLAAAAAACVLAIGGPAAAFPGFGHKAAAKPASESAKPAATAPTPPRKAGAAERAAAERLDPLARAAFWGREVDVDPTDAEAGVAFASALRAMGRYPEAAQAADRVLVVDPKNYAALLESARAKIGAGDGFYALDPLKRAQALQPGDWRPVSLQGVALEQSERLEEARVAYARALKLSPDNPAVLSNLALSYAAHGEPARAEQLLRRAVAQPAASVAERQNLALVVGLQGRIGEAERLIRQDLPPETASNNLAYLQAVGGRLTGPSAARSWASVTGAEAAAQRP